jgi:hypothetical protein
VLDCGGDTRGVVTRCSGINVYLDLGARETFSKKMEFKLRYENGVEALQVGRGKGSRKSE